MKLISKLSIVLRSLRLSHLVLALTFIPIALACYSLAINDVPLFAENLALATASSFTLIYVESLHMKKKGFN